MDYRLIDYCPTPLRIRVGTLCVCWQLGTSLQAANADRCSGAEPAAVDLHACNSAIESVPVYGVEVVLKVVLKVKFDITLCIKVYFMVCKVYSICVFNKVGVCVFHNVLFVQYQLVGQPERCRSCGRPYVMKPNADMAVNIGT